MHEPVTVRGAEEIAALPADTRAIRGEGITDDALIAVSRLEKLEEVHLDGCFELGNPALERLAELPALSVLYMSAHAATDKGLAALSGATRLREFGLDAKIMGTGFRHLAGLPALAELHLPGWTALTRDGAAAIAALPALERLYFYGAPALTDERLAALGGATGLKKLVVFNCKRVTDAGIDALAEMLPDCELGRDL